MGIFGDSHRANELFQLEFHGDCMVMNYHRGYHFIHGQMQGMGIHIP